MAWWREARFGLFVHWGVYAVPAGVYQGKPYDWTAEWLMRRAKIPVSDYKMFAKDFTALRYDPEAWAALAEEAGMKYIVITSKHHDGFALFDSQASDWTAVKASGARRDLIAPLAAAARKHGLRFGLYYSQAQDWTHPGGAKWEEPDVTGGWDEAQRGRFDDYLARVSVPQVREILTHFKPDILWWDTPHLMTPERAALFTPLLALVPGIITNDRLGGEIPGDLKTPEQHIPATGLNYDWETCMTMNDTWGFRTTDTNWKSATTLIRHLCDIASKGGNFLLNVGPDAEGVIPAASVERLREIGRWMKVNGESIYATRASPFTKLRWGRCTQRTKDNLTTLYLHIFDWPAEGRLNVSGLKSKIEEATLLATGKALDVTQDGPYPSIALPAAAPDERVSVIKVLVKGPLKVESVLPRVSADRSLTLGPKDADLHSTFGNYVELTGPPGDLSISHPSVESWTTWSFEASKPGVYELSAEIASRENGSRYVISCGGSTAEAEIPMTGELTTFTEVALGQITLPHAGPQELTLRPVKGRWKGVRLRRLTIRPSTASATPALPVPSAR